MHTKIANARENVSITLEPDFFISGKKRHHAAIQRQHGELPFWGPLSRLSFVALLEANGLACIFLLNGA